MNTTMQMHKVTQSWDIEAMQKAATVMVAHKIASRILFLDKHHEKEIDEMEKKSAYKYAEMLSKSGVNTPMDLVKSLAEYEVNMFGSEASINGDENCAVLTNEKSSVWLETIKEHNFSKDHASDMQEHYTSWMKHLGHKLGFKVHIEIAKDGNSSKLTFTNK